MAMELPWKGEQRNDFYQFQQGCNMREMSHCYRFPTMISTDISSGNNNFCTCTKKDMIRLVTNWHAVITLTFKKRKLSENGSSYWKLILVIFHSDHWLFTWLIEWHHNKQFSITKYQQSHDIQRLFIHQHLKTYLVMSILGHSCQMKKML